MRETKEICKIYSTVSKREPLTMVSGREEWRNDIHFTDRSSDKNHWRQNSCERYQSSCEKRRDTCSVRGKRSRKIHIDENTERSMALRRILR